jgi:excisionase family DNA binding protein
MTEAEVGRTELPVGTRGLYTTAAAAEYIGVSVRTVKNLISDGRFHYVKIGRATRIDLADLDTLHQPESPQATEPPPHDGCCQILSDGFTNRRVGE